MENPSEEQVRHFMAMKKMLLRKGMEPEARERLGRVRTANPELAENAEAISLQLIQQGKKIDDTTLKQILGRLSPKKEFRISRR